MRTRRTAAGGLALILAGFLVVGGCMRERVVVGRNPEEVGALEAGAGGLRGGSGGATGGSGGAQTAGVDQGGSGGVPANGGMSASVLGPAGGEAGAPFSFDAACDCGVTPDGEYYCTLSTAEAQKRLIPPSGTCQGNIDPLSDTTRADCSGLIVFRWVVMGAESFEVDLQNGSVTYASATGPDVGALCGIQDPNYRSGTISAGVAASADCAAQCSECQDEANTAKLPPCDTNCGNRGSSKVNSAPLSDYCATHACPASLADAQSELGARCSGVESSDNDAVVTTGCGTTGVVRTFAAGMEAFYFDAQTEALVGAEEVDDTPWQACPMFDDAGGYVPPPGSCAAATTCSLCAASAAGGQGALAGLPPACAP